MYFYLRDKRLFRSLIPNRVRILERPDEIRHRKSDELLIIYLIAWVTSDKFYYRMFNLNYNLRLSLVE